MAHQHGPLVKRLRLWPLTPATRVRFPHGSPFFKSFCLYLVGVNGDEVPPVPIPNTVVKLISVKNTWRVTAREDRAMPTFIYSSLAQSVEHAAVNRRVVCSSQTGGATISGVTDTVVPLIFKKRAFSSVG